MSHIQWGKGKCKSNCEPSKYKFSKYVPTGHGKRKENKSTMSGTSHYQGPPCTDQMYEHEFRFSLFEERYQKVEDFPKPLYDNIKSCLRVMVKEEHTKAIKEIADEKKADIKLIGMLYFLSNANLYDILPHKELIPKLWVYSAPNGPEVDTIIKVDNDGDCKVTSKVSKMFKIEGEVMQGSHVVVLWGKIDNRKVAVKWSGCRNVMTEYDIYQKLKDIGCEVPWHDRYSLLGQPVLVVEFMRQLNENDNIYLVGMRILEQLSKIHLIGCHNDIKPHNIMVRDNSKDEKSEVDFERKYFIIDHGGTTTERLSNGFKRQIWTDAYTSQESGEHDQFTCAKYDFLELMFTLQAMKLHQKQKGSKDSKALGSFKGKPIQEGFTGILKECVDVIDDLPENHEKSRVVWKKLHEILKRGYLQKISKKVILVE